MGPDAALHPAYDGRVADALPGAYRTSEGTRMTFERNRLTHLGVVLVLLVATAGLLQSCGGGAAAGAVVGAVVGAGVGSALDDCYSYDCGCYDCGPYYHKASAPGYADTW